MTLISEVMEEFGGARQTAEVHKKQGNEHFKANEYAKAIKCYSEAIALDKTIPTFFGNRSAAHAGNGEWEHAAADARRSVELDPKYTKGYYRLAQALTKIGQHVETTSAIEAGLRIDPVNKQMLALKKNANGNPMAWNGTKVRASKPTAGKMDLARLSLYDDKGGPDELQQEGSQDGDIRTVKRLIRSLRDSPSPQGGPLGAGRSHDLEGIFRQLTDPSEFRRLVMPGLPEEERRGVPSTLQELLRSPRYTTAVEEALPRVVAHARSVLEGVKARGRKAGDIMDAATEETLKPQVLQEAFAREVVKVIVAVHSRARAKAASELGTMASPSHEQALWDQLDEATVTNLMTIGKGFAVQDYFLGEDWVDVLLEDSIRFQVTGALSVGGVEREHGEMAWIEPDQIESNYPALHELLVDLHALPFELNLKQPGLRLSSPIRGSTMLLRLTEGGRVPVRLDSVAGGAETGHKVSAVYFIGQHRGTGATIGVQRSKNKDEIICDDASSGAGGELKLQNIEAAPIAGDTRDGKGSVDRSGTVQQPNGSRGEDPERFEYDIPRNGVEIESLPQGVVVNPMADRLVLFRSDRVSTETLEITAQGQEQLAVLFWMHGARDDATKNVSPR